MTACFIDALKAGDPKAHGLRNESDDSSAIRQAQTSESQVSTTPTAELREAHLNRERRKI